MFFADLYTKVVLTIIALCLAVLCLQGSRWSHLDTVHAQSGEVVIGGYAYNDNGTVKVIPLGNGYGRAAGIPVVVLK
jgi:hypothetical protein